jgi:hypothetical protein
MSERTRFALNHQRKRQDLLFAGLYLSSINGGTQIVHQYTRTNNV